MVCSWNVHEIARFYTRKTRILGTPKKLTFRQFISELLAINPENPIYQPPLKFSGNWIALEKCAAHLDKISEINYIILGLTQI